MPGHGPTLEPDLAPPRAPARDAAANDSAGPAERARTLGERLYLAVEDHASASPALLWAGPSPAADDPTAEPPSAADAATLAPEARCIETWLAPGPVRRGEHGCLRYATDGHWLLGTAIVDDASEPGGLEAAAYRIYRDLFAALDQQRCRHPLRLWNYLPRINAVTSAADGTPLERYRQFNIGRQRAFLDAHHSAFAGAPAACALGTEGGALTVHVLSGPRPVQPVENPRQVSAYDYPRDYGPRSPTFSRAAVCAIDPQHEALFVSGTASIVGHETRHVGDVAAQTAETLVNIAAVIGASGHVARARHAADSLDYTIYIRHAADLPVVRAVFEHTLGRHSVAARRAVYLRADVCRADLLVEIEAHGWATP